MSKKKVVVALGHDALGSTILKQLDAARKTAKALADLVEADYQLTITHSNGHQVSMIHKAMTELRRIYPDYTPAPMCVCSAMSQGYVGYDIQNSLKSELLSRGISKPVGKILTKRFMSKEDADIEVNKGNYVTQQGDGYRRIVAAPQPIDIVEIEAIKALSDADQIVIACGGGGIPVIEQQHVLKGASAVIEKDSIAGRLASDLKADELLILTSVDYVYLDFGKDSEQPLKTMTVADAKKYIADGQFGETDMLPKIMAAISYLEAVPSGRVVITSLTKTADAVNEKVGTVITA